MDRPVVFPQLTSDISPFNSSLAIRFRNTGLIPGAKIFPSLYNVHNSSPLSSGSLYYDHKYNSGSSARDFFEETYRQPYVSQMLLRVWIGSAFVYSFSEKRSYRASYPASVGLRLPLFLLCKYLSNRIASLMKNHSNTSIRCLREDG